MRSNREFSFHQVLHGYSDGHRLIETSASLTAEVRRLMLVLSDMSGPSMVNGFESYLTGYPLAQQSQYAFARTWYAPEMERPGCVWTHTILIDFRVLDSVEISTLNKYFRRPEPTSPTAEFSKVLTVDDCALDFSDEAPRSKDLAALFALYDFPEATILIPSENSKDYENALFDLWQLQWLELRKSFTFCTGAISLRKIEGTNLDLQVIPLSKQQLIKRQAPDGYFVDPRQVEEKEELLLIDSNKDLRKYIGFFGRDLLNGRRGFRPLLRSYFSVKKVESGELEFREFIGHLAEHFPDKSDAVLLKTACLGPKDTNETGRQLNRLGSEAEKLGTLLTIELGDAFDTDDLQVLDRMKHLCRSGSAHEVDKLTSSLLRSDLNPKGCKILKKCFRTAAPEWLREVTNKELLVKFVSQDVGFAAIQGFWECSSEVEGQILEIITVQIDRSNSAWKGVFQAILEAGNRAALHKTVNHLEDQAVTFLLDWIQEKETRAADKYEYVIAEYPDAIISWLENQNCVRPQSLAVYLSSLSPHEKKVQKPRNLWLKMANSLSEGTLSKRERRRLVSFCLSMSFDNPWEDADLLAARTFQEVHDALAENTLEQQAWAWLDPSLPRSEWLFLEWDRCERLRRGLVEKFIEYGWEKDRFLQAITDDQTLSKVISYCKNSRSGKEFLKGVKRVLINTSGKLSREQFSSRIKLLSPD